MGVEIVSSGSFSGIKFVERDKWIINHSDGVLMLWKNWKDNDDSSDPIIEVMQSTNGILRRTLEYAEDKDRRIYQLWPFWEDFNNDVNYEIFRESMMALSEE
jgi:hypothetical protein